MSTTTQRPRFEPSVCDPYDPIFPPLVGAGESPQWLPLISCKAVFPIELVSHNLHFLNFKKKNFVLMHGGIVRDRSFSINPPPRVQFDVDPAL